MRRSPVVIGSPVVVRRIGPSTDNRTGRGVSWSGRAGWSGADGAAASPGVGPDPGAVEGARAAVGEEFRVLSAVRVACVGALVDGSAGAGSGAPEAVRTTWSISAASARPRWNSLLPVHVSAAGPSTRV